MQVDTPPCTTGQLYSPMGYPWSYSMAAAAAGRTGCSIGPLLEAGHDVWAVDLPGFGDSDVPPGVSDADGMLPVLADLLQTLSPCRLCDCWAFRLVA